MDPFRDVLSKLNYKELQFLCFKETKKYATVIKVIGHGKEKFDIGLVRGFQENNIWK